MTWRDIQQEKMVGKLQKDIYCYLACHASSLFQEKQDSFLLNEVNFMNGERKRGKYMFQRKHWLPQSEKNDVERHMCVCLAGGDGLQEQADQVSLNTYP